MSEVLKDEIPKICEQHHIFNELDFMRFLPNVSIRIIFSDLNRE